MTEIDIAWLAGFLEGEGSFIAYTWKGRPTYYAPRIQVVSTDIDVMEKACKIMGSKLYGPYCYMEGKKKHWQTQVNNKKAAEIMLLILPFMGERRSIKIKELLSLKEYDAN